MTNMQDVSPAPRPSSVDRWGWYSIGINITLIALNLVISLASGSLAVEAELVHNAVDLLTAIGVLVGIKLAARKSRAFPYGLYKIENVITVVLALMTFFTAYEIARDALLAEPGAVTVNGWLLVGVVVAAVIPLAFSHYELRAGQAANSPALIADAREYRAHVFTTGVVLASLLGQWLGVALDRLAALVIVVAVAKTGWDLLRDGMRVLLDASLDAETIQTVREIVVSEPLVQEVEWLTGRNAGRYRYLEGQVTVRDADLAAVGAALRRIEARIRQAVPHIERVLLHADPVRRTHLCVAAPLDDQGGAISAHFGEALLYGFVRVRLADGVVEERQTLAPPVQEHERARGIHVAEWLVSRKVDLVLAAQALDGKGPPYVLRDGGAELVVVAPGARLEDEAVQRAHAARA